MPRIRLHSIETLVAVVLMVIGPVTAAMADGIYLEVVGGKVDVNDWVAETTIDLDTASKLVGWRGPTDQVAVHEVDDVGMPVGKSATGMPVASQVDRAVEQGMSVVCWRVPGKLAAGQTRRFVLRFDRSGGGTVDEPLIDMAIEQNTITVTNGHVTLVHDSQMGGMIRGVTVGDSTAAISWGDKIFDGTAYSLAKRNALRMDIKARGPLRAVIEVENEYVDPGSGHAPPSQPRAIYRFTHYAGLPFTLVEAKVTQEYAHQWTSLHFIQIGIGDSNFTHHATDGGTGVLKRAGTFRHGLQWAAAYNDELLIASCSGSQPGIWDGSVDGMSSYLRSAVGHLTTLSTGAKDAILWGPGKQAIEDQTVQHWHKVFAAPPTVRIRFDELANRLVTLKEQLKSRRRALAESKMSPKAWVAEHVALTLAAGQAANAEQKLTAGRFGRMMVAVESCEKLLNANHGNVQLQQAGPVMAGLVLGHPLLGNHKAVYLWAKPEDGAGLISIFDRETSRELLSVDPASATLWQGTVKNKKGGTTFANTANPCHLDHFADATGGRLVFRWSKGLAVDVEMRLGADEPLLRSRLNAVTMKDNPSGLVAVTYPMVKGIKPLTPDARRDVILDADKIGDLKPSPLVSGKATTGTETTPAMQFTGLIGDGLGLYFAEEDGQTNRKQLTWTANSRSQTLDFSIGHPVLGWGGDNLAETYQSPGDVVLGVFHGDWYDAARIYRKWAITAPWCAKGPVYARADYPQWLAKAPYWTLANLGDEKNIEQEMAKHEFFEIPTMVAHAYQYWFVMHQDDRYPEMWPPRLGSKGFKHTIERLQAKGIRVVPYLNGKIWDMDTESYRMEDAERKGTYWISSNGDISVTTNYGGGQAMVTMCPGSDFWRKTMQGYVADLVGQYGVDGVYFDFLTNHIGDCYNKEHGHPICGGNFWPKAVHEFYAEARAVAKKLNPDAMMCGEGVGEYCIDVHDTFFSNGTTGTKAPLFQAVYHGYTNLYGGIYGRTDPLFVGRWWLMGCQNGWHGGFLAAGEYYRNLLKCRWYFGTPYLGYGEMLRPPRITGDLAMITGESGYGVMTVPVVEGSVWKAPDGTVGLFFLNYHDKDAADFTWTIDLSETGIDETKTIKVSRWTLDSGLTQLKHVKGGRITESMHIEPLEIIALKLEVVP